MNENCGRVKERLKRPGAISGIQGRFFGKGPAPAGVSGIRPEIHGF